MDKHQGVPIFAVRRNESEFAQSERIRMFLSGVCGIELSNASMFRMLIARLDPAQEQQRSTLLHVVKQRRSA